MKSQIYTIRLISDTHGMLRKSVKNALKGANLIIHAGDIDTPAVLDELEIIAPVTAVRGNMDVMNRVNGLPKTDLIEFADICIYIIHDLQKIDLDPAAAGISVVVFGHSHQPALYKKDGVIFINPGSAGPRRSNRPISIGLLRLENGRIIPQLIEIEKF